jgi:hypothetical protein
MAVACPAETTPPLPVRKPLEVKLLAAAVRAAWLLAKEFEN